MPYAKQHASVHIDNVSYQSNNVTDTYTNFKAIAEIEERPVLD